MNSNQLIESAKKIEPISNEVVKEFHHRMEELIALVNSKMMDRKDIEKLIGLNNLKMMKDNHANHARFIYSILYKPNPEVLVKSILWVFRTYRSHGFSINYWPSQLNCWMNVLKDHLSFEGYSQIAPLYNWMLTNVVNFAELSNEKSAPDNTNL